jgi:hypothetical protein
MGVTKIIPEPARAAWKVMEVSRRSWIIGEGVSSDFIIFFVPYV